ncbi:DNRLRE domain-containing protein, partial [bacterium]|nr:DNRLRE domain-containing protein [bacterium]
MKLLESQKNYRAQNRPAGRSIKIQHQASIIHNFKWLVLIILLIIGACEEKIPSLQTDETPLEFESITSYADSLNFAQRTIEPSLGKSDILFVGNDEHVYAYTLMKFANLSALPDTLDSLISVSLYLQTYHQFQLEGIENPSIDISISQLNNSGIDPWTEDSTNVNNFDVNIYDLELLKLHTFSESDTLSIPLDTNLVVCWHDSSNTDYTLVLQQSDTSLSGIQAIYSKDGTYYPWLEVIYIKDGARDTIKIIPSEDLSILSFKTSENSESHMFINSGRSTYSYIKFNFEDELHDKNTVIAKANLHLTIDTVQSQLYGENFHLYFNFLDSALL